MVATEAIVTIADAFLRQVAKGIVDPIHDDHPMAIDLALVIDVALSAFSAFSRVSPTTAPTVAEPR